MAHSHDPSIPRVALIAAGGMILLALIAVVTVRLGIVPPAADPVAVRGEAAARVVTSRDIVFLDTADGSVAVRDAKTGVSRVAVPAGSKTGFIRGVMRGLARDRHLRDIGKDVPFRLTRWSNGDLTLTDTATDRTIELGAFGPTNRAAFEVLL